MTNGIHRRQRLARALKGFDRHQRLREGTDGWRISLKFLPAMPPLFPGIDKHFRLLPLPQEAIVGGAHIRSAAPPLGLTHHRV
ncbi:MAG: hypothetical protein LBU79_10110 [Planctomycetota bacterium]|jgi:hypothetical protein|nr:hypothetical protein [Planctomycetota bacterium]